MPGGRPSAPEDDAGYLRQGPVTGPRPRANASGRRGPSGFICSYVEGSRASPGLWTRLETLYALSVHGGRGGPVLDVEVAHLGLAVEVVVRHLRVVGRRGDHDEPERGAGGRQRRPAVRDLIRTVPGCVSTTAAMWSRIKTAGSGYRAGGRFGDAERLLAVNEPRSGAVREWLGWSRRFRSVKW